MMDDLCSWRTLGDFRDHQDLEEKLRQLKKRQVLEENVRGIEVSELLHALCGVMNVSRSVANHSIQVAFNLTVINPSCAVQVWSMLQSQVLECLPHEACGNSAALLIHRCARLKALPSPSAIPIFSALRATGEVSDDLMLAVESLVLLPEVYSLLDSEGKIFALECLVSLYSQCSDGSHGEESAEDLAALYDAVSKRFEDQVDKLVLKNSASENADEIKEIIASLDLLGLISTSDTFRPTLRSPSFVICVTHFLKALHEADKDQPNEHADDIASALKQPPVEKLDEISRVRQGLESSGITDSPSFELKQKLVKLVGNLVYRDRSSQDLVRESGGVPVLLNCCRMDARNPYLMQWGILAVRNMCEGNFENQEVIKSLTNEGLAPGARSVLDQFGRDGDKLEQAVLRIPRK